MANRKTADRREIPMAFQATTEEIREEARKREEVDVAKKEKAVLNAKKKQERALRVQLMDLGLDPDIASTSGTGFSSRNSESTSESTESRRGGRGGGSGRAGRGCRGERGRGQNFGRGGRGSRGNGDDVEVSVVECQGVEGQENAANSQGLSVEIPSCPPPIADSPSLVVTLKIGTRRVVETGTGVGALRRSGRRRN